MRVLVTGALGFVGRHLVHHLESQGDDVVGVDRHSAEPVDITDGEGMRRVLAHVRPEVVYHLAGWADVGGSWGAPLQVLRVNAEGTLNVLEAARAAEVGRVLVVSSADIYGIVDEADLPLDESAPLRPGSPYAASKVAADALAQQAYLGYGQAVIRARPFNHIGPGQSEQFVAPALAARIVRAERAGGTVAVGNLSARRDLTDVRDVVRAYRLLVEHGEPGGAYNICSGHDLTIRELAERLVGLAVRPIELVTDPALLRPVDLPVLRGDPSRLQRATGWRPEIPIHQTLEDLLEHVRAHAGSNDELERR